MINIDELSNAISTELEGYTQDVTDGVKKAVDTVGDEVNEEIKRHVTFNQPTGKYVKAFRIKTIYESRYNKGKVWRVLEPYYRLTHLLEKGHALRQGGRAQAFPHIKYGEELAHKRMEELAKEAIENANGR